MVFSNEVRVYIHLKGTMSVSVQEVSAFAKKMRVATDNTKTKCVDGGYRAGEAEGAMAFAGAHVGVCMALVKLGATPQQAFQLVYDYAKQAGQVFCWHTDTHEGHGCVVGCGHFNASIGSADHYGVSSESMSELLELVRDAQENRGNMEMVVLDRDHAEQAILVITSTDYTVKPWDQEDDVQYFIYDKVRHLDLLNDVAEYATEHGFTVSAEDLIAASDAHTNATLGLLGSSKGKQLFTVDASGDEPVVEEVGVAPIIEG